MCNANNKKKPYPENSCVEMSRNLALNVFYLQILRPVFVEITSCVIVITNYYSFYFSE